MAVEILNAFASIENNLSASKESWKKVLEYIGIQNVEIIIKEHGDSKMMKISSSSREEQSIIGSLKREVMVVIKEYTEQEQQERTGEELLARTRDCLRRAKG